MEQSFQASEDNGSALIRNQKQLFDDNSSTHSMGLNIAQALTSINSSTNLKNSKAVQKAKKKNFLQSTFAQSHVVYCPTLSFLISCRKFWIHHNGSHRSG